MSDSTRDRFRTSATAFTRRRKISFKELTLLIMGSVKKSIQNALCEYFGTNEIEMIPTKSAFSQRRRELKHELFIAANDLLIESLYEENELEYWNDYRLLVIDGSSLNLPQSTVLAKSFGVQTNGVGEYPMARMSTCFDTLNHFTISATITKYGKDEYSRACDLIEKLDNKSDLLLFDRGYGALWFMHFLVRKEKQFIIRLSKTVFPDLGDIADGSSIQTIEVQTHGRKKSFRQRKEPCSPFTIRLVSLTLDTGERELLATSLLDQERYPDSIFKELYALRWGIEESYKHLKVHTEIENFSGKTVESVKQDFYAGIFTENIRVMIELDANEELREENKTHSKKYTYQVNRNVSYGILKDKLFALLSVEQDIDELYEEIKKLFKLVPIPIIPGRHNPRESAHTGVRKRFFLSNRRSI